MNNNSLNNSLNNSVNNNANINKINQKNQKNYYPASITILLNTRILGHSKTIYNPNMSLPSFSSSSKTVYFNPLIKLDKNIVKTIPKGKTDDFIYEQFFLPNYFNSLLIRSQYYPQPKRSLEQATKDGIVDDNIRILLDILFKSDTPFYLDKKRYTSYGYTWNKGDWIIESVNSSKIIKKFYNYYEQSSNISNYSRNIYTSPRYNLPIANAQTIIPSAPMIVPTTTTLYQSNQLLSPTIGQPNFVTYQTPVLQSYPQYQSLIVPGANENPMFDSFNKFEENTDDDILHGSSASSTFGDIIEEQQKSKKLKKPRMTADKEIVLQGKNQVQPTSSNSLPKSSPKSSKKSSQNPLTNTTQPTINKKESQSLIDQFLFFAFNGFKNGFIYGNKINCSSINTIDDLKNIQSGNFYKNKIEPWSVLSNDGNGDCLFYVFCQILNTPDYRKINSILKTRKKEFNKSSNRDIAYYDNDNNYTVSGLRNLVVDFILYNDEKGKDIQYHLNNMNTNRAEDQYIDKNDINVTFNNMRTCADPKNRKKYNQRDLSNPNNYYWGDEISIQIIEYVFQLKTIIIHKPDKNDKSAIYTGTDTSNSSLKTLNKNDYIEIDYMDNSSSHKLEGYLHEIRFKPDKNLESITILKNNEKNDTCNYEMKTINNSNGEINNIYKIGKYKIYNNKSFELNNNTEYNNFVYILYHDNYHYETIGFNKRDGLHYIFNNNDISNFHPYVIYMIFIYTYLISSSSSSFSKTSLNIYLKSLYDYYTTKNVITKNKILLGGAVNTTSAKTPTNPLTHRISIDPTVPTASTVPIAPTKPTTTTTTSTTPVTPNPLSHRVSTEPIISSTPSEPTAPMYRDDSDSNPDPDVDKTKNSYYGQFKNYINDKLNQQLSIDDSGSNIQQYYANPNLSYYVVVDLELFPGDNISSIDKRNLSCQIRFDNIRKSYANLLGYSYQPSLLNTNVMPTKVDNRSQKSRQNNNNSTKKNNNNNNNNNKNNINNKNNMNKNNINNNKNNTSNNTRKYRP
jgi:hypothetical protein